MPRLSPGPGSPGEPRRPPEHGNDGMRLRSGGEEQRPRMGRSGEVGARRHLRIVLVCAAIAVGLTWAAYQIPLGPWISAHRDEVARLGRWGPLVFGLAYALAVVAMVPGSGLTLAAGALF